MTASASCRDLIKSYESWKPVAYLCPAGVPTIGWGHCRGVTKQDVKNKRTISKAIGQKFFDEDVAAAEADVEKYVKVPLTQGQFDCLVSFVFNVGGSKFGSSTIVKLLNKKNYDAIPAQMMRWVNALNPKTGEREPLPGLVRRRRAELVLWRGVDDNDKKAPAAAYLDVEPTEPARSFTSSLTVQGAATAAVGGTGVAIEGVRMVNEARDAVEPLRSVDTFIIVAIGLLIVVGACVAIYGRWRVREETAV
jgi:GH24 family phage-related lysozyme (muramidase)